MIIISKKQIDLISSIIYEKLGISIEKEKYDRLQYKLENMLRRGKYSSIDELCERLYLGDSQSFLDLTDFVTTCHTFFFREKEHFDNLINFLKSKKNDKPLLIWSAACSTGEEPYSIAISLLEANINNFHIIASDINRNVLSAFNKGIYHESRLSQIPPRLIDKYFVKEEDCFWKIDKRLRKFISIKNINLMDKINFPQKFDFIFCRNVFIYFNEESRTLALSNIIDNLQHGGLLFIGHAEVLLTQPQNLKKIGNSIYCKI